ncbi:hypothetical protein BH24ACT4_BH24ACT4_03880 [soil metagenome]
MVLSQKQRGSIYSSLAPVIGEEEADALLSQFPTRIGDEPVTRDVLRADLAELRTELKDDMAVLRIELKDEMAALRIELKDEMAALRTEVKCDMSTLSTGLKEDMSTLSTGLKGDMSTLGADLRTELHDQMRQMAMWVVGAIIVAMVGGMSLAAGIASALS